jgi:hypothetical protein
MRDDLTSLLGKGAAQKEDEEEEREEGKQPVLAQYIKAPLKLQARYKRKTIKARVRRDGSISFQGTIYHSPSQAAAKACGRRTCNGWTFWQYERAPGDWVPLNELRK